MKSQCAAAAILVLVTGLFLVGCDGEKRGAPKVVSPAKKSAPEKPDVVELERRVKQVELRLKMAKLALKKERAAQLGGAVTVALADWKKNDGKAFERIGFTARFELARGSLGDAVLVVADTADAIALDAMPDPEEFARHLAEKSLGAIREMSAPHDVVVAVITTRRDAATIEWAGLAYKREFDRSVFVPMEPLKKLTGKATAAKSGERKTADEIFGGRKWWEKK